MIDRFRKAIKSAYVKNFAMLAGSAGVAQAIQIGVAPILTRLYSPDDFGHYELFNSVTVLLMAIAFLQYDVSIYSSKNEKDTINSFALSLNVVALICFLVFLLVYFFKSAFLYLTGASIEEGWEWILPIYLFFAAGSNLFITWFTKHGSFKLLSKVKLLLSVFVASTQIFFGYLQWGYWGLVYSTLVVQFIAFTILFVPFWSQFSDQLKLVSLASMKKVFVSNKRLPLLVLPGNFLNNFTQTLPAFFLGRIDTEVLGYYSLARRIIGFPLAFITTAVQKLYIKDVSDEFTATGSAKNSFNRNLKIFSGIAFVLLAGILLLTKPVLPILFGAEWAPAIPFVMILSVLFLFRFVFGGLSFIMVLGKAPKIDIFWQIGMAVLIYSIFTLSLSLEYSALATIVLYVSANSIFYLLYGGQCAIVARSKKYLSD